jgi:hypothetical protein
LKSSRWDEIGACFGVSGASAGVVYRAGLSFRNGFPLSERFLCSIDKREQVSFVERKLQGFCKGLWYKNQIQSMKKYSQFCEFASSSLPFLIAPSQFFHVIFPFTPAGYCSLCFHYFSDQQNCFCSPYCCCSGFYRAVVQHSLEYLPLGTRQQIGSRSRSQ